MTDAADNFEIRMPTGTDDPLSDAEIQQYRQEIDRLDRVIPTPSSAAPRSPAPSARPMGSGGTRLVHTRELAIINRSARTAPSPVIANALLQLGRDAWLNEPRHRTAGLPPAARHTAELESLYPGRHTRRPPGRPREVTAADF